MKKFIFLGMAIQAVIIGLAVLTGSNPKPGQYFFLAGLLILSFILLKLQEKKKVKEELPKVGEHLIDCYSQPFTPSGWSVKTHQKGGYFKFDPAKISLFLSEKQKEGNITGHDLRKELENKPVMNANILDYLLANPELIPESWKGKKIFFWGTIYCYPDDILYVRCLYWSGSEWGWHYYWLDSVFNSDLLAALAS